MLCIAQAHVCVCDAGTTHNAGTSDARTCATK